MKYIVILLLLVGFKVNAQSNVYGFSLTNYKGDFISLSDFKGKRLVIATVAKEKLQSKTAFIYWDSIQKANPRISFFIVPVNDFGADSTAENSVAVSKSYTQAVTVSRAVAAKKDKTGKQDPLLRWLTNASENGHFDEDIFGDEQMFVISEAGVLYAVIGKGTGPKILNDILRQEEIKYQ